jgi:hypothetical protein
LTNFDRSIKLEFEGVDIAPITDLKIVFEIDKNDGLQFNHGLVTIFNLPKVNREKIARPHPLDFPMVDPVIKMSLFAGYRGKEVLLVSGDVLSAINNRQGPTWMTNIDLYSGLNDSSKGNVQVAFSKPTSAKVISDQLLGPLGIDIKYTQEALEILKNKKPNDFSASGISSKEATVFLDRYGLAFTIEEGGQGLVYKSNRPRDPNAGKTNDNTFSPQNGLIGTPQITRAGINIKSQLRSRIKMFEKIFVESATTTGTLQVPDYAPEYHVIGMKHAGDNRGADWFSSFECVYSSLFQGVY